MKIISQISRLLPKKLGRRFKVLGFLMILVSILESFSIAMFVPIFTFILDLNNQYSEIVKDFFPNLTGNQLVINCLIFLVFFYFLKNFFQLFFLYLRSKFEADSQSYFNQKLYSIYLNSNYEFFTERNSSILLRNITIETENIKHFFYVVLSLFSDSLILTFILFFLLIYNFKVTIICLIIISVIFYIYKIFCRPLLVIWGNKRLDQAGIINKTVSESFLNIKLIKLWNLESRFLDFINLVNKQRANLIRNLSIINGMPKIFLELLIVLIFSIFFILSLFSGLKVDKIILDLSIYGISFFKLVPSLTSILASYSTLKFYTPSAKKIVEEINIDKKTTGFFKDTDKKFINFYNILELQNINFSYQSNNKNILNNINIKINAGDKIGIYGPSGSGKSTLVDIILKLIYPSSGKLIVDNIDVTCADYLWGKKVGYIQQNSFLFDDTLKNNIILNTDQSDQQISKNLNLEKVLKISKIDKFLKDLPNGLETVIGDKGIKLSGGQRQRIAIARALYYNPDIIVLDESTNQLDKETQGQLLDELFETFEDKTILLVSHEYKLFKHCNKILILEKGKLTEK